MKITYDIGAEIIRKTETTCVGIYTEQFNAEQRVINLAVLTEGFGILHLGEIITNTVLHHVSEYKKQKKIFKDGCLESAKEYVLKDWHAINSRVNRAKQNMSVMAASNVAMVMADDNGNAWLFKTGKIHIISQTDEPVETPDKSTILSSGFGCAETLTVVCAPIKAESNIVLMTNGITQNRNCMDVCVSSYDSAPRDIIQKISHLVNQTKETRSNSEGIICIRPSKCQD